MSEQLDLQTAEAPAGYVKLHYFTDGVWTGFAEFRYADDAIAEIKRRMALGYTLIHDGAKLVIPVSTYTAPVVRKQRRGFYAA